MTGRVAVPPHFLALLGTSRFPDPDLKIPRVNKPDVEGSAPYRNIVGDTSCPHSHTENECHGDCDASLEPPVSYVQLTVAPP